MDRRDLERWFKDNGFVEEAQGSSGHITWALTKDDKTFRFVIAKHTRTVSTGVVGQLVRRLEEAGFDRKQVRKELGYC
jgi:hypothetical protein